MSDCSFIVFAVAMAAQQASPTAQDRHAILWVLDGAGDFRATSSALVEAASAKNLTLEIRTFVWSHGFGRVLSDQLDQEHARVTGERLAALLVEERRQHQERKVFLAGHSAGCGVILAAAERLPKGTLERIALLAPAVRADRDLRPALRASRKGVDVYCSANSDYYLRFASFLATLTRGDYSARAGRLGFEPTSPSAEDEPLFAKLRQFPWKVDLTWTGNHGGHYGCYQLGFLYHCVLPFMLED